MTTINSQCLFIFPGQGSQYSGIGSDIHAEFEAARAVYDEASEVLGYDIAELSFRGADDTLTLTRNTQPVLLTHAVACLRVFQQLTGGRVEPHACAGHSLGEYSALVAAGALRFDAALRLVQRRGQLMGEHGEGEMLALPLAADQAGPLAERYCCAVAGLNLKDQTVVGGAGKDLDRLERAFAADFPRKRAVRLKTEGAFHTFYMVTAAREFRADLDRAEFAPAQAKVLCNYTGGFHDDEPESIKTRLFFQLFYPVRWLDNLNAALASGSDTVVEFGGGIGGGATPAEKRPNLEGMVKKAQRGAENPAPHHAAINSATLRAAAEVLAG